MHDISQYNNQTVIYFRILGESFYELLTGHYDVSTRGYYYL